MKQTIASCSGIPESWNPHILKIRANELEHLSGDALAAGFFHIYGADIGSQVFPVMEIILDHAESGYDGFPIRNHIPLGNGRSVFRAFG